MLRQPLPPPAKPTKPGETPRVILVERSFASGESNQGPPRWFPNGDPPIELQPFFARPAVLPGISFMMGHMWDATHPQAVWAATYGDLGPDDSPEDTSAGGLTGKGKGSAAAPSSSRGPAPHAISGQSGLPPTALHRLTHRLFVKGGRSRLLGSAPDPPGALATCRRRAISVNNRGRSV